MTVSLLTHYERSIMPFQDQTVTLLEEIMDFKDASARLKAKRADAPEGVQQAKPMISLSPTVCARG